MRRVSLFCISVLATGILGMVAFGSLGKMIRNNSARAAALDTLAPQGRAPGWSRGVQNLSVSFDECTSRARRGLEAEGYTINNQGGSFSGDYYVGSEKQGFAAVIACNSAPDGRAWANVFVGSLDGNGNVAGAERQRLQAQMDRPASGSLRFVWERVGTGDCPGNDLGTSEGFRPDDSQAKQDLTAVCWDGSSFNNTFGGNSGRAFCTYKSIPPDRCTGGNNRGVMYRAVRQ